VLKSYFNIALRTLMTHRLYSAINLFGLAIGLACCVMMFLFVQYELSYDKQYQKSDRIGRIQMSQESSAGIDKWPRTGAGWKALLDTSFPEIKKVGRIYLQQVQMEVGDLSISEAINFADQEVLDIFQFEFVRGESDSAFNDINSVVLTESTAKKLFGELDPMGKIVSFYHSVDMKVTGVIKDLEENTHLANYSFANLQSGKGMLGGEHFLTNMFNMNFYTYMEMNTASGIKSVDGKLAGLIEDKFGENLRKFNVKLSADILPLEKLHLHSRLAGDLKESGDINQVYLFSAVALLILLIACINFMNLATARASQRAKEVGVRKAIGVKRGQIVIQFLSESVILSVIALIIAMALVELALPSFNGFINRSINFDYLTNPSLFLSLVGLTLLVGLLAGSYPAFYLSAFSPAKVLKGDVTRGRSGAKFRKMLVVFQFFIATFLLISTFAIYLQMEFAKNIKLGYEKDKVLILYATSTDLVQANYQSLEQQMEKINGVKWVSGALRLPGGRLTNNTNIKAQGQETLLAPFNSVDYDFFQNYGVEIASGRYFNRDYAQDTLVYASKEKPLTQANVILNQTAARRFGWTDKEAIGKVLDFNFQQDAGIKTEITVVGVVKDYHFESVRDEIKPIVHYVNQSRFSRMTLKLDAHNMAATIEEIQQVWKTLFPTQNISYAFLDDNFNAMYADEERVSVVYGIFSALAICIACLGLFGLASFTTEQRTKEIGVRKVLGASSKSIVILLTTEFSRLVIVASVFAWPVAYYLINEWLQNFVFRIELNVVVFIVGTLISLLIAWATVGGLAAKAAMARPVKSLRYE